MKQQLDLCLISSEEKYDYNSTFESYTEVNVSHERSCRRVFKLEATVRSEKFPEVREHILDLELRDLQTALEQSMWGVGEHGEQ